MTFGYAAHPKADWYLVYFSTSSPINYGKIKLNLFTLIALFAHLAFHSPSAIADNQVLADDPIYAAPSPSPSASEFPEQTSSPVEVAPTPNPLFEIENSPTENSPTSLEAKVKSLIKSAMKVIVEEEGVVSLAHPGHSYAKKTQFLFFRQHKSRIEMIATGVFNSEKTDAKTGKKELLADLDRDTIIKYPHAGDYAVPMSDPNLPATDGKDGADYPAPEEKKPKEDEGRPGYFELGMGLMFGDINTTASAAPSINFSQANEAKVSSNYRFPLIHGAYYSDYIPIGVEYDSYQGTFPTATRVLTLVTSSESISQLSFYYRFKPFFGKKLGISAKVNYLSDHFITNNTDDSLLNTNITGLGFGVRAEYNLVSQIWKKKPNDFFLQFQNFFGEFLYYPSITADDLTLSRGTSTGSTAIQYRLGATAMAWFSFIPFLKRWIVQGSYGMRAYSLKFSGPTTSEAANPAPIASGGTSKESESDFRFFVGFRIEDPITLLFKDKNEDDDGKGKKKNHEL